MLKLHYQFTINIISSFQEEHFLSFYFVKTVKLEYEGKGYHNNIT